MRFALLGVLCGLFVITSPLLIYGQRNNHYQAEVGVLVSTAQTPFWLRANQYGTVPLQNPALRLNVGLRSDYRATDSSGYRPKIDWGYGLNLITNAGTTNQFLIPEAYLKVRFGALELYAGRRKEIVGLVDTLLTTGSYAWSGNALPIPKIQVGLPSYTPIPFTKGAFSVMGVFAHGWFENADRLITGSYLHQTYVYGRIGKPSWRFRLYGGFNHEVIWAGYSSILGPVVSVNGQLPSTLRYFPAVVLGTRGNDYTNDKNLTSFEDNRIGNHLGSLDLAADINFTNWNLFAYRQFLYDDGSLFYGTNLEDGLNGLRLKNRQQPTGASFFLRQITAEYLFTGSQGGELFIIDDPQRRGRDDYFNHSQFLDGWAYFGRTIGTPFLTPQSEALPSLPSRAGIVNNRVSVFHLGLSALVVNKVDLTARLSYSRNAGTYPIPYLTVPAQFSGLLTASLPINLFGGTVLNGSFAIDAGELLPNSMGAYISLRKTGILGSRPRSITSPRRGF